VAIAFLPKTILVYALAFLMFRVLDILKPFPARRMEDAGGGVGVVLDDVVVGVYTNVLIRIMLMVRG
jgi:phosphatidylglycerophosphatase A